MLAVFRAADDPWQAFAQIYTAAFAMIFIGYRLLKYVGAWPAR